jgi:hypothetical protein
MVKRYIVAIGFALLLSGCVSTQFKAVTAGQLELGDLEVEAVDPLWNKSPKILTGYLHKESELWTRDGLLLDYLLLVPGVTHGEAVFRSRSDSLLFPPFNKDMLPNEIVELTEASLVKLNGDGVVVTSSGLRPYRLGDQRAVMFDLELTSAEEPRRFGRAVAFVRSEQLYLMLYVATELYYFDKHWGKALATMDSARVAAET